MRIWSRCRDAWGGTRWPDGGALLDQPAKLATAFDVIAREWERPEYKDEK